MAHNAPPVPGDAQQDNEDFIGEMWNQAIMEIMAIDPAVENWRTQALPLARIKKIMKSEEAVFQELEKERLQQQAAILGTGVPGTTSTRFMIASEAPLLLGKACEIMIREMTLRAWRHTKHGKRRTLQRQDLYAAVGDSEMFDFLIDLVPRITPVPPPLPPPVPTTTTTTTTTTLDAGTASSPASEDDEEVASETAEASCLSDHHIMTISDAEQRYTQLQQLQGQMQEQYMMMQHRTMVQQQQAPDSTSDAAPAPPAAARHPGFFMHSHFQIQPPPQQQQQGEAPSQWQEAPAPPTDINNGTDAVPPPGI